MSSGHEVLREMKQRLRELGDIAEDVAPEVAVAVQDELTKQIERGVGPDGRPWKLTRDGRKPLRNAAKALTVRVIGSVILTQLTGPEARHHLGAVRGKVRRAILPTRRIPDPMVRAIRRVIEQRFEHTMGVR